MVPPNHEIGKPIHLFSKIDKEFIEKQIAKLGKTNEVKPEEPKSTPEVTPVSDGKTTIEYADFVKLDLRVATIKDAERVPKTDKLLKLILDVGGEERTVVSGIAGSYSPDEIIGQQVTLLANLAPRKLRGVVSQGMILMAEEGNGKLSFVSPDRNIDSGSTIS